MFGGKLWEISGSETCPSFNTDQESMYTNYPICIGPSCNVTTRLIEYEALSGEECYNKSFEVSPVAEPAVVGKKCQDDMLALMLQKGPEDEFWGIGSPNYVWEEKQGRWAEEACNEDYSSCDFAPSHQEIQALCEKQGGDLYSYSDELYNVKTYNVNNSVVEWTDTGANIPVCIASSCDGKKYIQELIFPYHNLHLNGTFVAANWTTVKLYKLGDIEAVLKIPAEEEKESADGADESQSESAAASALHHFSSMAVVAVVLGFSVLV